MSFLLEEEKEHAVGDIGELIIEGSLRCPRWP